MKNWSKAVGLLEGCGAFNHPSGGVSIDNRVITVVGRLLDTVDKKGEINKKLSFGLRKAALDLIEVANMLPTYVRDECLRNANTAFETALNHNGEPV